MTRRPQALSRRPGGAHSTWGVLRSEDAEATGPALGETLARIVGLNRRCCFAQVHERKNHALNGILRADYLLEGKSDCVYGDQKHHDFWLANQWRIVEITASEMTVMNMCGIEETLNVERDGHRERRAGLGNGCKPGHGAHHTGVVAPEQG